MADFYRYASRYLVDKPVIAMNSDIGEKNKYWLFSHIKAYYRQSKWSGFAGPFGNFDADR